jgi:hypothetical protein
MDEKRNKVALVKSHGRVGYGLRYWHPVEKTLEGKPLRIHRGLGTKDEQKAIECVNAMESLLSRPDLWSNAGRATAERLFPAVVVEAFYDYLKPQHPDFWAIREVQIEIPGPEKGYARILYAGTTGAGKSTLERQMIGAPPEDRFPAASTAKTTVCDWEIVVADTPFKAVVTFQSRDKIRQYIEDCIARAASASITGATKAEVARKFLIHEEERFRLNYILGNPKPEEAEEEFDEEEAGEEATAAQASEEQIAMQERLESYLARVMQIAGESRTGLRTEIQNELGPVPTGAKAEDLSAHRDLAEQAFDERLDDYIRDQPAFIELVETVLDDVASRFDIMEQLGTTVHDRTDWPTYWALETESRPDLLKAIKWFSDNHWTSFGRLLTPLVEGIRIRGRFKPAWRADYPKLVYMDRQGNGHVAQVEQHLPTAFTKRFDIADAIVLVDSAKQPMQAGTIAILRSIIESGQESKLFICSTHLDTLDKTVWPSIADQKAHLLSSLDNAIGAVANFFGNETRSTLGKILPTKAFYFFNLDKALPAKKGFTQSELERLFSAVLELRKKAVIQQMALKYDAVNLAFRIQKALQEFHEPWQGTLGLRSVPKFPPEHHARIRALARRLGVLGEDHYHTLQPVSSLADELKRHLRLFLSKPLLWPDGCSDEEKALIVEKMTAAAKGPIEDLASEIIFKNRTIDWKLAYDRQSGPRPARLRAQRIQDIYDNAAPVPGEDPSVAAKEFLSRIRDIARNAIAQSGGTLLT